MMVIYLEDVVEALTSCIPVFSWTEWEKLQLNSRRWFKMLRECNTRNNVLV